MFELLENFDRFHVSNKFNVLEVELCDLKDQESVHGNSETCGDKCRLKTRKKRVKPKKQRIPQIEIYSVNVFGQYSILTSCQKKISRSDIKRHVKSVTPKVKD